jgi:hypothetical protein
LRYNFLLLNFFRMIREKRPAQNDTQNREKQKPGRLFRLPCDPTGSLYYGHIVLYLVDLILCANTQLKTNSNNIAGPPGLYRLEPDLCRYGLSGIKRIFRSNLITNS